MNTRYLVVNVGIVTLAVTACSSTPQNQPAYNGVDSADGITTQMLIGQWKA